MECYLLWQKRIKISKHFSYNTGYELQLQAGLFFMNVILWALQRSSLLFREDIEVDFRMQHFNNSSQF